MWFSVWKTCLRIWISADISGFSARRPKFKVVHLPDNPWVSDWKPCFGFLSPFLVVPDIRKPSNFQPWYAYIGIQNLKFWRRPQTPPCSNSAFAYRSWRYHLLSTACLKVTFEKKNLSKFLSLVFINEQY